MPALTEEHSWFSRGARALEAILTPTLGDKYVCPLCRTPFERSEIESKLSVEHVPPSSVGGRPVALTCQRCNNTAGTLLDAEMLRRHNARQLANGGTVAFEEVEALHEGELARGRLTIGPGTFSFEPIDKQNHPQRLQAHREVSARWASDPQPGREIELRIPMTANPRRADLSWVRSAFLVAFATFGYLYTFQPAFGPLLDQFRSPDERLIDPLPIFYEDDAPLDRREVALVTSPHLLRSVLVRMGQAQVFLPSERDDDFFSDFADRRHEVAATVLDVSSFALGVTPYEWPSSPQHLWDGVDRPTG